MQLDSSLTCQILPEASGSTRRGALCSEEPCQWRLRIRKRHLCPALPPDFRMLRIFLAPREEARIAVVSTQEGENSERAARSSAPPPNPDMVPPAEDLLEFAARKAECVQCSRPHLNPAPQLRRHHLQNCRLIFTAREHLRGNPAPTPEGYQRPQNHGQKLGGEIAGLSFLNKLVNQGTISRRGFVCSWKMPEFRCLPEASVCDACTCMYVHKPIDTYIWTHRHRQNEIYDKNIYIYIYTGLVLTYLSAELYAFIYVRIYTGAESRMTFRKTMYSILSTLHLSTIHILYGRIEQD